MLRKPHSDTRPRIVSKSGGICDLCPHGNAVAFLSLSLGADPYEVIGVHLCPECIIKARRGFGIVSVSHCGCCGATGPMQPFTLGSLCDTCRAALNPVRVGVTAFEPHDPTIWNDTTRYDSHSHEPLFVMPVPAPLPVPPFKWPTMSLATFLRSMFKKVTGGGLL